jgi:hypothetical protein
VTPTRALALTLERPEQDALANQLLYDAVEDRNLHRDVQLACAIDAELVLNRVDDLDDAAKHGNLRA